MTCPADGQGERQERSGRAMRGANAAPHDHISAPSYILVRAAWIPSWIWRADGRFTRLEGVPCDEYAAALAARWRLRPA
jgi:hypothetical protein